jgi:two-component system sensor histidine kinase BaeS
VTRGPGLPRTLRGRLFAAIALIVLLSLGLTLGIGLWLTKRSVEHASLRALAKQASVLAERERIATFPFAHLRLLRSFVERLDERLEVVPLRRSSPFVPAKVRSRLKARRPAQGSMTVDGRRYLFAAQRVGNQVMVLLRPAGLRGSDWHPFLEGLLIAALIGAALAAVVSLLLARAVTRPVGRVARASRSLAAGASPKPIPVEGADEVASLAASFNEMAERLRKAQAAERSFLLSVSHELKTPLTAIRGYAEGLAEEAVTPAEAVAVIRAEAGRLERLVQDLLDLARMNKREFAVHREQIDLAEVAAEVVRRYETQARSFEVRLEAVAPAEAPATGDADRLVQIASNLVENALRSTPAGGSVVVRAEPGSLAVEDTGPGLAAGELPHAFERFFLFERYRGRRAVGTGLGLAIVKELAEAMGGSVEVQSEPGRGTTFTVRLPAAQHDAAAASPTLTTTGR